jgi:hypothetical protein
MKKWLTVIFLHEGTLGCAGRWQEGAGVWLLSSRHMVLKALPFTASGTALLNQFLMIRIFREAASLF